MLTQYRASEFELARWVAARILERNPVSQLFFAQEARRLAEACREMAERFLRGGRLIAFGHGAYATDAQHVSVEFVHPVIVGKRALPAMDLSMAFRSWVPAVLQPDDIVMGFGPPEGDDDVLRVLAYAHEQGAMTFALPGSNADYSLEAPSRDPHIHQEMVEVLCHTLYETVHVFFEHRELGHDVGASGFLYPFLGQTHQDLGAIVDNVASSIVMKASDAERLREQIAREQGGVIASAIQAIRKRVDAGGKLILFGNGGSATDATDWAIDCVMPEDGSRPIPAVSLSVEPAIITAVANDVGTEVIFLRQLIAQARPNDIAIALSTSGGSTNIIMALEEGRKRNLLTVALLGYDGGEIRRRGLADFPIVVRCDYIPRIQEAQAAIYHVIREGLECCSAA